jgi:uncharacterized protein
MWIKLAHFIIKFRLFLVIGLGIITLFMGYHAQKVEMSYDFRKSVPDNDPDMVLFNDFKALFGEDGNLVAIGFKDSAIYQTANFAALKAFSEDLAALEGVNEVISLPLIQRLEKDTADTRFVLRPIFETLPTEQSELDSLLQLALNQKFYSGQLINTQNGALLTLVSIQKETLHSAKRIDLTNQLAVLGDAFSKQTGIEIHYAGLPFVRSVIADKVANEMKFFLLLSVLVTGLILMIFFRAWNAVIFPMAIIGVVVVWVVGTLSLLDYKITLLTGLIPPVIVVIGIPNSIYLLNKYHQEYELHGNKMKAISRVIRKIGLVTLITNFTTAIGFLVLAFTDIVILKEFGIVAGINIMATFIVSIILIPGVFSWLPAPKVKHLKHLKFKPLDKVLTGLDLLVHRHRTSVYVVTSILVGISIIGMYRIEAVTFMVDDIPEDSTIKKDLDFLEENFSGVMPLEVIVDTGVRRGVLQLKNLRLVDEFEQFLGEQEYLSQPVSMVSFVKAARQAFYNGNPARYDLPANDRERGYLLRYLRSQSDSSGLLNSFVDSTAQFMRVSLQMADIGSDKMDDLINHVIQPKIDTLFADSGMTLQVTGTTPIFIKGNKFLIENLRFSLILAFIIISVIMAILFMNFRMILISLVPNLIPLIITAGIMGYFNIPLKPSTALIFSIAFGISVDDSIHFLAKYRQELFANSFFVPVAVSKSLRETGASMMYTSIVLFAGFIIFAWSDFGGTVALGILTSTTLVIAMFTNLIVLPALLLTFDDGKRRKDDHPLIEQYDDGFYIEDDDEEIDLQQIKVLDEENGKA